MNTEQCFNLAIRKTARIINQFYEKEFCEIEVNISQFTLIRAISLNGSSTNSQLQKILVLDQTTLSRTLKPLLRDGFIQETQDKNDARIKIISLTRSGKELFLRGDLAWRTAQKKLAAAIGEESAQNILSISEIFSAKLS